MVVAHSSPVTGAMGREAASPHLAEIPRVSAPSAAEFRREYENPAHPVVLTGLIDDWPALECWSPEYFSEQFGECRITAAVMRGEEITASAEAGFSYVEESVAECMAALRAPGAGSRYLASPVELFPERLREDYRVPVYCAGAPWLRSKVWAGTPGMRSPLHRDLAHNLYAQVSGRKHWALFAPGEGGNLYPASLFSRVPNGSRADALLPDLERFPRLAKARGLCCTLEPGEVLYLPSLWWHQTRAETLSMSMNFWWARGALALAARSSDLAKRLLGISR